MSSIKAQDVTVGTKLADLVVASIEVFKCGNGETGYRYTAANGATVWNRHGEELVLADEPTGSYELLDHHEHRVIKVYGTAKAARAARDRKNREYGANRYSCRPIL